MINYKIDLPEFKGGEKEYPLIQLCTIQTRSSDYYKKSEFVGEHEGAMILQPNNIENNTVVFKDLSYYSWKGYNERPRDIVEVGDIIMCKMAAPSSPYKSAVVTELPEPAITSANLFLFKDIRCNPLFLQLMLSSPNFQKRLKETQNKGTVPSTSVKKIYDIKIPVPGDEEQENIVNKLLEYRKIHDDLISKLEYEVKLRNEQYGYYTDKLLWY